MGSNDERSSGFVEKTIVESKSNLSWFGRINANNGEQQLCIASCFPPSQWVSYDERSSANWISLRTKRLGTIISTKHLARSTVSLFPQPSCNPIRSTVSYRWWRSLVIILEVYVRARTFISTFETTSITELHRCSCRPSNPVDQSIWLGW